MIHKNNMNNQKKKGSVNDLHKQSVKEFTQHFFKIILISLVYRANFPGDKLKVFHKKKKIKFLFIKSFIPWTLQNQKQRKKKRTTQISKPVPKTKKMERQWINEVPWSMASKMETLKKQKPCKKEERNKKWIRKQKHNEK